MANTLVTSHCVGSLTAERDGDLRPARPLARRVRPAVPLDSALGPVEGGFGIELGGHDDEVTRT
jgi:hypothetical protein